MMAKTRRLLKCQPIIDLMELSSALFVLCHGHFDISRLRRNSLTCFYLLTQSILSDFSVAMEELVCRRS